MEEHILFDNSQAGKASSGRNKEGLLDGTLSIHDIVTINTYMPTKKYQYFKYINIRRFPKESAEGLYKIIGDLVLYSFNEPDLLVGKNITVNSADSISPFVLSPDI